VIIFFRILKAYYFRGGSTAVKLVKLFSGGALFSLISQLSIDEILSIEYHLSTARSLSELYF